MGAEREARTEPGERLPEEEHPGLGGPRALHDGPVEVLVREPLDVDALVPVGA